jgi:hypothetical protein
MNTSATTTTTTTMNNNDINDINEYENELINKEVNNEKEEEYNEEEPEFVYDEALFNYSTPYVTEDELNFCKSCTIDPNVEGDEKNELNANIRREFMQELSKSYDPNNESDDEVGMLIKMRRLTEAYATLFNKNVEHSPASQAIIEQCVLFIYKIKKRIRDICEHIIMEDDVEISGDRMVHIIYCNRCETMFE